MVSTHKIIGADISHRFFKSHRFKPWMLLIFLSVITTLEIKPADLIKSDYSGYLYEINEIRFVGNTHLKEFELLLLINSTISEKAPIFGLLDYYNTNMKLNPYSPDSAVYYLDNLVQEYNDEVTFYNQVIAEDDVASIKSFYNMVGFHEIGVHYTFLADTIKQKNILRFYIDEGPRYSIGTIQCLGIDSATNRGKLYLELYHGINTRVGEYYDEDQIIKDVVRLDAELKNSGYFYSKYKVLPVWMDTITKKDSIVILFNTGILQTVGECIYQNDTTRKTKDIAVSIKEKFNKIHPGSVYRESAVKETEYNFNTLGLFEKVYIDTMNVIHDDTLNFVIATQLGNRYELDAGVFLNHTPADNNVNTGLEGRFTFRNPFGGGEEMVFYGNLTIKDVNNIVSAQKFEGKAGVNFFQPMIWYYKGTRIGGAGNIEYAQNNMDGFLVDHWYLPKISFPWYLKKFTHFNKMSLDISLEGEYPRNYTSVIDTSIIDGNNTNLARNLVFFEMLNDFWSSGDRFKLWTATIIGVTGIGDHRNHPFAPTHGHYTRISVDAAGLVGIAEFLNVHATHQQYAFQQHHKNIVHAYRINIGKIFYNKHNKDKYVPFEVQYYCGGANSNRGWVARELHASKIEPALDESAGGDSLLSMKQYRTLSTIYGSAGLFEFNYEYRYNFIKHGGLARANTDRISALGVVGFVDIGNAYGWFVDPDDEPESSNITDMLGYFVKNLAVSAGVGLRYMTPIGPIRLDLGFPIYGPVIGKDRLIFKRGSPFQDMSIHFGIGHTF